MSYTPESAPESISELFARDPLKLNDQNIDTIVAHLRDSRAKFVAGDLKAGSVKATKAIAEKPQKGIGEQLDLGDLGL